MRRSGRRPLHRPEKLTSAYTQSREPSTPENPKPSQVPITAVNFHLSTYRDVNTKSRRVRDAADKRRRRIRRPHAEDRESSGRGAEMEQSHQKGMLSPPFPLLPSHFLDSPTCQSPYNSTTRNPFPESQTKSRTMQRNNEGRRYADDFYCDASISTAPLTSSSTTPIPPCVSATSYPSRLAGDTASVYIMW